MTMVVFFWFFAALIFYAYAGYPALLIGFSRFFKRPVHKGPHEPRISVILSAFNEERFIEEKINNLLSLDYPPEKMEILIGSDGGSDQTDAIVARCRDPRVKFFRFISNLGKPHVLNGLVSEAHGAVLVFTDARQRFEPRAIRELVENFHDPEVGCVSGELYFEEVKGAGVSRGMDAYWKYEKMLRRAESRIGSMLGATGAIYAVRRRLFTPVPLHVLVDDMYTPLMIVRKGYRAVFDGTAKAFDLVSSKGAEEFKRKVRTLAGNFQIFALFPDLLDPVKSPIALQFFSHKVMRLLVPFFLGGALITNGLLLANPFYRILFLVQGLFYGLAALEAFWERASASKGIGYIPYTFCMLNYAALTAFIRYLRGDLKGAWEKAYQ